MRSVFQPRSVGNSVIASRPSATNSHNSSGEVTPPGYRQLIATTAIGSVLARASRPISRRSRSASFRDTRSAAVTRSSVISAPASAWSGVLLAVEHGPYEVVQSHGVYVVHGDRFLGVRRLRALGRGRRLGRGCRGTEGEELVEQSGRAQHFER